MRYLLRLPLGGRRGGVYEFTKSFDEPSEGYNPKLMCGPDAREFFWRCLAFGEPISPQACFGARGFFNFLIGGHDLSEKELTDRFEEMIFRHELFVNGTNEPPLMPFVERSKAADLDSLKYRPIDEILNEPKKKTIELELIYEDLEKTPARDTPYRITFSNNQVVNGTLDERGQAILPNMPDLPAKLEYGLYLDYSEKQFNKVLDELKGTYAQLESAIDQTVKAIGAHMLAVAESKPEPPADMYEAATQLVEKELAQLEAENERYNNLSYLEKSFLNIRGAAGGVVTGVEEYIPDLGEFGDLLTAADIDISDVVSAIVTGNIKAIREIETKFQKWPKRGAKGLEQASLAMEVLILLLLDPRTRDLLASASVRMMKALPPHELIKITATQFTQMGIDALAVSGGTAGGTLISGPGGAAACLALLAAASMRKGGKILEGLVEILNKIAMRLKPLVANQYAYAGGVNTKNKSVLMYSEAAEKHEAKHRGGGDAASKKDKEKNDDKVRKCPRCNAIWKKKTPTLSQVRSAVKESLLEHTEDVKSISPDAQLGYSGSVAIGKVGNPEKPHKGMEPDIRGECGTRYDIDGFLISDIAKKIRPFKGKRWGKNHPDSKILESLIRKTLRSKPDLKYMDKGKKCFSIVVYLSKDIHKPLGKGGKIIVN